MSRPEPRTVFGWPRVQLVTLGADLVALGLALTFAYGRFSLHILPAVPVTRSSVAVACVGVWIAVSALSGLYRPGEFGSGLAEYEKVFLAGVYSVIALIAYTYLNTGLAISRGFLAIFFVAAVGFVCAGRLAVRVLVARWAVQGHRLRKILIVGANPQGVGLARELRRDPGASSEVVGFLDDYQPFGSTIAGLDVLGEPTALYEIAEKMGATHAVIVQSALGWESLSFLVSTMHRRRNLDVLLAPGLFDVAATPLEATELAGALLLRPHPSRIIGFEAAAKRVFDLLVVVPVLLVTLPLQAAIGLSLLLSRRPVLAIGRVLGRNGRPLLLPSLSGAGVSRAHLSRLPSLWLVLSGDMSVIGPRPLEATESALYEGWKDVLSALKPGFIGPWWLAARSRPAAVEQGVEADLLYARSYRFWMDFKILAQVLLALVRAGGGKPPPDRAVAGGT